MVSCKFCSSESIVKKGLRKLKTEKKQVYLCKNCNKKFSVGVSKKKFDIKIILDSLCAYAQGYSYEDACDLISRKHKIIINKSSIERWSREYDMGYLDIRPKIIKKYGFNLIIGRMFKHSGLIYKFKYHKGKLNEFGKFFGLKKFISELRKGIDDGLFNGIRCSDINLNVSVNIKELENTKLNKNIGKAIKIIKSSKQRHSVIENLLLNCDRDTMAVEVPVWYWDKGMNAGICGHIDILQVKYGKLWILDYKPKASEENINSVVSQLWNYARALSFRTNVALKDIKCCWFDEDKLFTFDVDKVKFSNPA
ncbi:MAG: hypothetical protein AB1571_01385 [Nanoarchaeota archaeon]